MINTKEGHGSSPIAESTANVTLGSFLSIDEHGYPLVDYEGNETGEPRAALSCVALNQQNAGCEVAIGFLNGDRQRPIVLGVIKRRQESSLPTTPALPPGIEVIRSDGEELVLKCGKASITLTREGKILLSGEYVVSRSYGVNRIQGATVQIN